MKKFTVGELIEGLSMYNRDLEVYVDDKNGYYIINSVELDDDENCIVISQKYVD